MSGSTVYGRNIQEVQQLAKVSLSAFPINSTVKQYAFSVPAGYGPVRILGVSWVASAIYSDTDGLMTVEVKAYDASEAAADSIVAATTVEGGVADVLNYFDLATEDTEKQLTLDEGDSVYVLFVNDSAAINTNGAISVNIHYHPIPLETAGNDVRHASFYRSN